MRRQNECLARGLFDPIAKGEKMSDRPQTPDDFQNVSPHSEIERRANMRREALLAELSEQEKREMIEQVKSLRKEYDKLNAKTQESFFAYLRDLAGPYADLLIHDKDQTLKSISSSDPAIRQVALRLASCHWDMVDEVADQCEVLAQTDPVEEVREIAIGILGLSYSDTKEMRIARIMARAVKDSTLSDKTRLGAYYGLVLVDGRHNHSISPFKMSMSDIHWEFVEKYLTAE
jgi:hypothetical protein